MVVFLLTAIYRMLLLEIRGVKMVENEDENLRNIAVYWKVIMITFHTSETRRFGSLSSAKEFIEHYKMQQQADHKIFKVTEEEIE